MRQETCHLGFQDSAGEGVVPGRAGDEDEERRTNR